MASGLDNKISNIIGTKLPQWLIQQLDLRANRNSDDVRSNENLLYLANKSAWVRLVSSVDIDQERDQKYFSRASGMVINNPQSLAKNFVLFGGTSKYEENNSYQLRSGVSYSDPNKTSGGAYGILGKEEIQKYGYRPMPGIMSVNIETQGRLGSIRGAIINFKCWDKQQLDIIDALYFKLGFTMFLEWGHTYFYTSKQDSFATTTDYGTLRATEDYALVDPFRSPSLSKEEINFNITKTVRDTQGNYDAMLGMVTNFNFSYNQDGGYDCTLRLMSLGMLGDSIKINNPSTLPNLLKFEVLLLDKTLKAINEQDNLPGTSNSVNPEDDPKNQTILRILNRKINNIDKEPDAVEIFRIISNAGILNSDTTKKLPIENNSADYDFIYPIDNGYRFFSKKFGVQIATENEQVFVQSITLNKSRINSILTNAMIYYNQNIRSSEDPILFSPSKYVFDIENDNVFSFNTVSTPFGNLQFNSRYIFYKSPINNRIYYIKINIDIDVPERGSGVLNIRFKGTQADRLAEKLPGYLIIQETREGTILKIIEGIAGEQRAGSSSENLPLIFDGQSVDLQVFEDYKNNFVRDASAGGFFSDYLSKSAETLRQETELLNTTIQGNETYAFKFSGQYSIPTKFSKKAQTVDSNQIVFEERSIKAIFTIETNDSSLISNIVPTQDSNLLLGDYLKKQTDQALEAQNIEQTTKKEQERQADEAILDQVQQSLSYQSALELTLRTIQVHALNKAIWQVENKPDKNIGNKVYVLEITKDITEGTPFLKTVFSNGIFSPFIDRLVSDSPKSYSSSDLDNTNSDKRLEIYAKYGFLSSLLGNNASLEEINLLDGVVDYNKLLTAFVIPYRIEQELVAGIKTNHPVYIPFGFLLMLLNHSCTIYDTKKESNFQKPLVYIDYNPNLNFFLSNNQQLSTDPFKVLIPFEGTDQDYQKLFYDEVLTKDKTAIPAFKDTSQTIPLFKPRSEDLISFKLQEYSPIKLNKVADETAAFRGRVMNILLSIDYLTDLVRQYSLKDGSNNVFLRPFLESILTTINKSLGNFNALRLGYNDVSNTFQIIDDQVIPTLGQEMMVQPNPDPLDPVNRTEIPLIGKTSIAKSLETRTDISSKLGSLIAISANPKMTDKSTLSTNGDPPGFLNTGFSDRYVTNRLAIESNNTSSLTDSRMSEAIMFNSTITDFYSSANPSDADVSQVTSYYIEKMSKVKNEATGTLAAAMVPIGVNFTTDGIGGLNMYQAFTVSDELLPYSYTMQYRPGYIDNYSRYVGFVIVGLNHTIEANQWNTSVRTNMIALKDKTAFKADTIKQLTKIEREFVVSNNNVTGLTNFVASNNKQSIQARAVVDKYLGRPITDTEWNALVSIINAESSNNDEERANILAVILNRAKNNSSGIIGVLKAPNQFEPVTGRNTDTYLAGPSSPQIENRIYNAIITYLPKITVKYNNFVSANRDLFYDKITGKPIKGRDQKFYDFAIANKWPRPGNGGTLFGNYQ